MIPRAPVPLGQDTASTIAVEHVLWAVQSGVSPFELIQATGMTWSSLRDPDWHDAVLALSSAWRRLSAAPVPPLRRAA